MQVNIQIIKKENNRIKKLKAKYNYIQNDLANMLEKMDMWDHVVVVNKYNSDRLRPPDDSSRRDPNAPYNKVKLKSYKGWAPSPDGSDEKKVEAIRKWMPTEPGGQMVFCRYPRLSARAMGKKAVKATPLPKNLRAWWGPNGIVKK